MSLLAIIIPAFKCNYLHKTLETLANQTNKNFSVYIGNDNGDIAIKEIVEQFENVLNITYCEYPDNLGGKSLVKQWERCFELVQDEEWMWLLPDDDYIDSNCVESFYFDLQSNDFDLYRFNVHFVTADEKIFKTNPILPLCQRSYDSLIEKLCFSRPSTIAEFIFRKKKFIEIGFSEIPMAWGTDDILWYLMGREKGICGCNRSFVYLRQSYVNISNNYTSFSLKKIDANFIFFKKLLQTQEFLDDTGGGNKRREFGKVALNHILYNLQDFKLNLSYLNLYKYSLLGNDIWGGGLFKNARRLWLNNRRVDKLKDKLNG